MRAYTSIWLSPTCSDMPMLAIASNDARGSCAVVLHADLHPLAQARLGHALARALRLGLRQRDAHHLARRTRAPRASRSCPSRSRRRARACPAPGRACPPPARVSCAAPPPASARPARRSRSCRSSTRRGTARRSRCRRRSGSAPPPRRARRCAGARAAVSSRSGRFGQPARHRRRRSRRQAQAHAIGRASASGGSNSSTTQQRPVEVVDRQRAVHVGAAEPERARAPRGSARAPPGAARRTSAPRSTVAGTAPPSQKRTLNGRVGKHSLQLAAKWSAQRG